MKQFEFHTDPKKIPTEKENREIYITLFLCLVFLYGYIIYDFLNSGDLWWALGCLGILLVFLVLLVVYGRKEDVFQARKVTISQDGVTIKPLKPEHYSWEEIKTVSIENVRDTFIEYSYSATHYGHVLIISPELFRRRKGWHPAAENQKRPDMVCVFLEKEQDFRPHLHYDLHKGRYLPYFEFFMADEDEIREALSLWKVQPTYDYRNDYYGRWNNRQLAGKYGSVIIEKANANDMTVFTAVSDADEVIGLWFAGDGWDEEKILLNLRERTQISGRILLNYALDAGDEQRITNIMPNAGRFPDEQSVISKLLDYPSIEKEDRVRKAVHKLASSESADQFKKRFTQTIAAFSDDSETAEKLADLHDSLYGLTLRKPDLRFSRRIKKAAETTLLRETGADADYRSRVAYSVLKKDRKMDKDLLWKLGQQGYHW